MKKTALILTLVLVTGLVFAFHGEGKEGRNEHGKKGGMQKEMMMGRMMEALELSDAQKNKIEALNFEHKKQMIEVKAELETLQLDKREAMKDNDFAAAKKLNSKIFDTKEEIANARLDLKEKIMKELTPEQQEKAKELHKKIGRRKMMKEHHGGKDGGKGEGRRGNHKEHRGCDNCQDND